MEDVESAEAQFAELQRELSGISQDNIRMTRTRSRKQEPISEKDVENSTSSDSTADEGQFDLESTLHGNHRAEEESGIRPKHLGVVWDKLSVCGAGGVTNFVRTFPDAFVSFFNVVETAMMVLGVGKKGREVKILKDF